MRRRLALVAALLSTIAVARSSEAPLPPQDAYVWQRRWTPALRAALAGSAALVTQWRVLVAETDGGGALVPVDVDWSALGATRRPVIAVIRIDGTLARLDEAALLGRIRALALRGKAAGLEIDYDCATARLAAYGRFLTRLRAMPDLPSRLSITALPAWMGAASLPAVLAQTDEAVLQVHAVEAPENGLFDAGRARRWIDVFAALSPGRFRVALPDYGARADFDADGRLLAIESEVPRLAGGVRTGEMMAMPADAARLLRSLRDDPPEGFAGIVWFRLPTADDALTWSSATWRAVLRGDTLDAAVTAERRPTAKPGLDDIVLLNRGDIDAPLPQAIDLPPSCRPADGVNGYALEDGAGAPALERHQSALLRGHHVRTIGWARCAPFSATTGGEGLHVRP
jgi:hypothetical protein